MDDDLKHEITESSENGVCIKLFDWAISDAFEDYLNEEEYVLFNTAETNVDSADVFEFYFGIVADRSKVEAVFQRFLESLDL